MIHLEKYLPIGSIVLLKSGQKRVMIYGRRQIEGTTGIEYDYISCLYPEGNMSYDTSFLFNHDQIDRVYFLGFQDEDEFEFQNKYLRGENK